MLQKIELTQEPIDVSQVLAAVSHAECGAEVLFVGTTRQWTQRINEQSGEVEEVETSHLIYEAFEEMALSQMKALAAEAGERWPVRAVAIVHRLGRVDPMEASVAVAVSCPHRSEAFEAAQWLMDSVKHQATIWKQEHYVQVGAEWIHPTSGSCRCPAPSHSLADRRTSSEELLNQQSQQQ